MIAKEWQNQGLGYHIFSRMCDIANERGLRAFVGEFMKTNTGIDKILFKLPYPVDMDELEETIEFTIDLTKKKM